MSEDTHAEEMRKKVGIFGWPKIAVDDLMVPILPAETAVTAETIRRLAAKLASAGSRREAAIYSRQLAEMSALYKAARRQKKESSVIIGAKGFPVGYAVPAAPAVAPTP